MLEDIQIKNFRNLAEVSVEFSDGLNVLQGENGQGKTNLMEAIYLLGTTKSFRRQRAGELTGPEGRYFCLSGVMRTGDRTHRLQVRHDTEDGRIYQKDGKRRVLLDYIGSLHTVAFTSDHLRIVRGPPEERRNFIDRGIFSVKPAHLQTVIDYRRALRQKNRFLSQASAQKTGKKRRFLIELETWNDRLSDLGSRIIKDRAVHVSRLRKILEKFHLELFGESRGIVDLHMITPIGDEAELAGEEVPALRTRLQAAMEEMAGKELDRSISLVGPHRDDLEFLIGGRSLKRFGSSGQQRGFLLAAKLSKAELFRQHNGSYPVFLFDDFESELDRKGRLGVLSFCRDRLQLFIAVSADELDLGRPWSGRKQLRIRGGQIHETANS